MITFLSFLWSWVTREKNIKSSIKSQLCCGWCNSQGIPVPHDKLKRGGVSNEEMGSEVLVRKHDSFTVLGKVQSLCHPFSIVSLWFQGTLMVIHSETFHYNSHTQLNMIIQYRHTLETWHDIWHIAYLRNLRVITSLFLFYSSN